MSAESLSNPEFSTKHFLDFVENHADIVLEPPVYERNVTRLTKWEIADASQLTPLDSVEFKVMIDLGPDQTIYHEIKFAFRDQPVFWLGYDSGANEYSSVIGTSNTDSEITTSEVRRIVEELSVQEQKGCLRKRD